MDKNLYNKILDGIRVSVNIDRATTNDMVIGKLEFVNKTDNTIFDSLFKLYPSENLICLENNLYVNGEVGVLSPYNDIKVPSIYPGESLKIIYKCRVKEIEKDNMDSMIFILSDENNSEVNISKSCPIYFYRNVESFNNITIEHRLIIPEIEDKLKEIVSIMVEPKIIKQYVVKTLDGISLENNISTGNKLMLRILLNENIEYIIDDDMETAKWMMERYNISTYIMLPKDNIQGQFVEAIVEVNKVLYKIIGRRQILLTINLNLEIMAN